jgi:hypothetical protein
MIGGGNCQGINENGSEVLLDNGVPGEVGE